MRNELDQKMMNLENMQFKWELFTFSHFVIEFPVFSCLEKKQVSDLKGKCVYHFDTIKKS